MSADVGVLVTRPNPLGIPLAEALKALGMHVWQLPTLEISPCLDSPTVKHSMAHISEYAWHLFVSRSAVSALMPQLLAQWPLQDLAKLHWAAVGPGTAAELKNFLQTEVIYPEQGLGGEALLQTLENKIPSDARVLIWCGDEATPTLLQGLQARGIAVESIVCYRREKTTVPVDDIQAAFMQGKIQFVTVSSGTSLQHLVRLLNSDALYATTLIVVSDRLRTLARSLGFTGKIILASGANDAAMVQAIQGIN